MSAAGARLATPAELDDWDEHTVRVDGGHVYQSRVWGERRAALGWQPLHVVMDDGARVLVLVRRAPVVGSGSAYIPRGPVRLDPDPSVAAGRVVDLAAWLAEAHGIDVVSSDAEVAAAESGYGDALRAAGFRAIPEIQPSRHRISLAIPPGADDAAIRSGVTKSTRQRFDRAARDGLVVTRHDRAGWDGTGGAAGEPGAADDPPLFADAPDASLEAALAGFADLLTETGKRRGFRFGPRHAFLDWWRAGLAAGHIVYLAAHDPAEPARTLGGLLLYRHGERLSTVHSGDADGVRERHPGVMHLLRWRAIQLAIREGRAEMDLGGVDVGPDHAEPDPGSPMAGLYEHKRSFGATWVAMTGAHERAVRPWRVAAGRVTSRVARLARR